MAVLSRVLESQGFRVAILPQPDWRSAAAWRALGRPRLFYAVSAGNMDSMINHYTANKKRRNDDAYSPGGRIGLRPDRPTPAYAQRCREAFPGVPVVIGGIEASLRRIAHFDYWSEQVRPSMLAASKADLLAFGKGEATIVAIARRLAAGQSVTALRELRGVAYLLGARETLPVWPGETLVLPSLEDVTRDPTAFARMTRTFHHETNPFNAKRLTQAHGDRTLVLNPPCLPIGEAEMDAIYDLSYTRRPHPRYAEPIPAHTMIKDSVQIMRGCFGGCTFCSITMHEGRVIQSRSPCSILRFIEDNWYFGCIGGGSFDAIAGSFEHRQQGAGDGVEGAAADATEIPVIFNEAQDRALVGDAVIDKVLARERRDDQQQQAKPVAAAALLIAERRRAPGADRGVLPGHGGTRDGRGGVTVP